MMTDRELLEAAAKAARVNGFFERGVIWYKNPFGDMCGFNPLKDDGDALRLAVKLHLWEAIHSAHRFLGYEGAHDLYAATRMSIVHAAAEIGVNL